MARYSINERILFEMQIVQAREFAAAYRRYERTSRKSLERLLHQMGVDAAPWIQRSRPSYRRGRNRGA